MGDNEQANGDSVRSLTIELPGSVIDDMEADAGEHGISVAELTAEAVALRRLFVLSHGLGRGGGCVG